MRVIVLVKATVDSEAGTIPSTKLMEAMGLFNKELANAGVLLVGEGLKPSSEGKRVSFDGPGPHGKRRAIRTDWRAGRGILAMGSQGYGRGGGVGQTLPQSDARTE